jgi:hypothetical protein
MALLISVLSRPTLCTELFTTLEQVPFGSPILIARQAVIWKSIEQIVHVSKNEIVPTLTDCWRQMTMTFRHQDVLVRSTLI